MIIVLNFLIGLLVIALLIGVIYLIGLTVLHIVPDMLNYRNDFFGIMLCGVLGLASLALCITFGIFVYHLGTDIVNRLI